MEDRPFKIEINGKRSDFITINFREYIYFLSTVKLDIVQT